MADKEISRKEKQSHTYIGFIYRGVLKLYFLRRYQPPLLFENFIPAL